PLARHRRIFVLVERLLGRNRPRDHDNGQRNRTHHATQEHVSSSHAGIASWSAGVTAACTYRSLSSPPLQGKSNRIGRAPYHTPLAGRGWILRALRANSG